MQGSSLKDKDWVLTTKLNTPLIRSDILDRPKLLAHLEQNIGRTLTFIAAPAVHLNLDLQVIDSSLPNIDTSTILGASMQIQF